MTVEDIRVDRGWLSLREPADAAARATELVEDLGRHLPATGRRVIHDLGCGTGAMGRWLAPLLPGPQHWVVHDRDPDLLEVAAGDLPAPAKRQGVRPPVDPLRGDTSRSRLRIVDGRVKARVASAGPTSQSAESLSTSMDVGGLL